MFACAHPEIEPAIRTPLILQTILGFTAEAIVAAFLVPPRRSGNGSYVPLDEQDTARWNLAQIRQAEAFMKTPTAWG